MLRTLTKGARALALFTAVCLAACGGTDETAETEGMGETEPAPQVEQEPTAPATGGMLNPNEATRDELLTVPNLDESLADVLIQGRPFDNMLGVDQVLAGPLDEEQRDSVYTRLWMPIDLNTATAEEILLIPGVGPRMQHEFEEYRPYSAIEQFRREIGKYVDDAEVARLERYVEIR
jgi:DNA uptake protein ComE-like DNA-binding protein